MSWDSMVSATVAITGLDSRDNPYPGLALARSLRLDPNFRGKIIALTYDVYCTGQYRDDIFDEIYIVPYPSEPEHKLLSRILEIHRETSIDVIFPALDSEIAVYTRLAPTLKSHGIASFLPSEEAVKSRNKDNLYGTCQRLRIRTPKTIVLTHTEQLDEPIPGLNYPMVIKGSLAGANIVHNCDELKVYYHSTLAEWGFPVLLQEKLVGEEYDITCLADTNHEPVAWTAIKKFAISSRGKASSGVIVNEPELGKLAREILQRMKWTGPCELELMKETATGRWFLLEINARFPAWIYHTAASGCNMPALALRYALGIPPEIVPMAQPGMLFFRNRFSSIAPVSMMTDLLREGRWVNRGDKQSAEGGVR